MLFIVSYFTYSHTLIHTHTHTHMHIYLHTLPPPPPPPVRAEPPLLPCCPSCSRGSGGDGDDQPDSGRGLHLRLRLWSSSHLKKKSSSKKESRDSALVDTLTREPAEPEFNPAYSNKSTDPTDSFTYMQRNPHALQALGRSVESNGYSQLMGGSSPPPTDYHHEAVGQSISLPPILEEK